MKKLFSRPVLYALAVIMFSCQDEKISDQQVPETVIQKSFDVKPYRLQTENDVLSFESIEYYQSIVDSKDSTQVERLTRSIEDSDFKSFGKLNPKSKLFDNDFMEAILDKNQIVKIGKWFIRINPETGLVFAASSDNPRAYQLVENEDRSNSDVHVFSCSDDVLDQLKDEALARQKSLFCSESGIGSYHYYTNTQSVYSTSWTFNGSVRFSKFGIYYSLYAEAASNTSGLYKIYIELAPVYYHARCGVTNGEYNVSNYQSGSAYYSYHKYQSYQGSKNLNEVYFRGRVKAVYTHTTGVVYTQYTNWVQIRVNY